MNDLSSLFWNASLEEIKKGYVYDLQTDSLTCLVCGEPFLQGRIYSVDGLLFDARKAAEAHIAAEHSSIFEYLLGLGKEYTGFTDHQKELLMYFYRGYSDKEISEKIGGSTSTVRNHRFNFREKEKQAKIILAVLELLKDNVNKKEKFIDIHRTAKMIDGRYAVTEDENEKILKMYFKEGPDGPLGELPKKEKKKIAILKHLIKRFDTSRKYSEREVNDNLREVYGDYVTLRRCLVEYGFMDRNPDGSAYWVKNVGFHGRGEGSSMDKNTRSEIKLEYKQTARAVGVYQIRNTANGRFFVGSSKNLDGVFNRHKFELSHGGHRNKELQREWNEYGHENFAFEVLERLDPDGDAPRDYTEELEILEEAWLEKLQPYRERGYNKPPQKRT